MGTYNVGDTVRILDVRDLPDDTECGKVDDMKDYIGKTTKIIEGRSGKNVRLEGVPYWWAPNWLEPVSSASSQRLKYGDKARVINTKGNRYTIGDIIEYGSFDTIFNCKRLTDGRLQKLGLDQLELYEEKGTGIDVTVKASSDRTYSIGDWCKVVRLPICDSKPRPGIRKEIRDRLLHL